MRCPQCGPVYDVSQYSAGHTFACQCGHTLEVGATRTAANAASGFQPTASSEGGLLTPLKMVVFFGNLCGAPIVSAVSLIAWFTIRDDSPRVADDLCKYTWIPFVIWIVLFGLYLVFAVWLSVLGEMGGF